MSNYVDNVLAEIYSGESPGLTTVNLQKILALDELDEYVEESARKFLNEMRELSYVPLKRVRLAGSFSVIEHFSRSIASLPADSICFAVYLVNISDKTEWMKEFFKNVGVRTVGLQPMFLHYDDGVNYYNHPFNNGFNGDDEDDEEDEEDEEN